MKTKFACSSCNWKFMRNEQPKVCPFCGKQSVAPDKVVSADDLLQEA